MPEMRVHFGQMLNKLTSDLLELGSRARGAVARGAQAFVENNPDLANDVISEDYTTNDMRYAIEQECYRLLAMEAPVVGDLRAIVAGLIVSIELERIADHGKKLAKITLRSRDLARPMPMDGLVRMSELAVEMLDRSMEAIARRDPEIAREVIAMDDALDALYKQLFNVTLSYMLEQNRAIGIGTYIIEAAHELERVGDRATNIAERVIYVITGQLADQNV